MAGDKDDGAAAAPTRQTYMPKPPSKDEVDQVSREQAMVTDDWTGEPSTGGEGQPADETSAPENEPPPPESDA